MSVDSVDSCVLTTAMHLRLWILATLNRGNYSGLPYLECKVYVMHLEKQMIYSSEIKIFELS